MDVTFHSHPGAIGREPWDALCARMRHPTIYHTYDWTDCWLRHLGEGRNPMLVTVRKGNEVVGVAPLMTVRQRGPLGVSREVLTFLSAMSPASAQYLGPICAQEHEKDVLPVLARAMVRRAGPRVFRFEHFLASDVVNELIEQLEGLTGRRFIRWCGPHNHKVELGDDPEVFLGRLPKKFRKNLKADRNRLAKAPGGHIEHVGAADRLEEVMEAFRVHSIARFQEPGKGSSTLSDDRFYGFFRDIVRFSFEQGRAICLAMNIEGRIVGSLFALSFGPWLGHYNGAFDRDYRRYSPGNLLVDRLIEEAIGRGFGELDLLVGFEDYKRRWSHGLAEPLQYASMARYRPTDLPFLLWDRWKARREPVGRDRGSPPDGEA